MVRGVLSEELQFELSLDGGEEPDYAKSQGRMFQTWGCVLGMQLVCLKKIKEAGVQGFSVNHSSFLGSWDNFLFENIINNAAMNIFLYTTFCFCWTTSFGSNNRIGLWLFMLIFKKNFIIIFKSTAGYSDYYKFLITTGLAILQHWSTETNLLRFNFFF